MSEVGTAEYMAPEATPDEDMQFKVQRSRVGVFEFIVQQVKSASFRIIAG